MPTADQLQAMTDMARPGMQYRALSADDREMVIKLAIMARHAEALEVANHVAVYGDYPEGFNARFT